MYLSDSAPCGIWETRSPGRDSSGSMPEAVGWRRGKPWGEGGRSSTRVGGWKGDTAPLFACLFIYFCLGGEMDKGRAVLRRWPA